MFIAPVGSSDKYSNLTWVSKDANARDFSCGRRLRREKCGGSEKD
jgi:hypothetical protein